MSAAFHEFDVSESGKLDKKTFMKIMTGANCNAKSVLREHLQVTRKRRLQLQTG